MSTTPFTGDAPCVWYCLWSRSLRQIVRDDDITEDGVFAFVGSIPTFDDRGHAERHAAVKRMQYPAHVIEVISLPATPPSVPLAPPAFASLAAMQVELSVKHAALPFATLEVRRRRYAPSETESLVETLMENVCRHLAANDRLGVGATIAIRLGRQLAAECIPFDQEAK